MKNAVDLAMLKNPDHSIKSLIQAIEKSGIDTVLRQNNQGVLYGVTYVDHQTKCVFNGSDLGKPYSAKGIQERCGLGEKLQPIYQGNQLSIKQSAGQNLYGKAEHIHSDNQLTSSVIPKGIEDVINPSQANNYLPNQLQNLKKKKKKQLKPKF